MQSKANMPNGVRARAGTMEEQGVVDYKNGVKII